MSVHMAKNDKQRQIFLKVITAWKLAGLDLGVKVMAPFDIRSGSKVITYAAALPDFGGKNGMLVGVLFPPEHELDESAKHAADIAGKYVSFINAEAYEEYKKDVFKDALRDWGYFGAPKHKPKWMGEDTIE